MRTLFLVIAFMVAGCTTFPDKDSSAELAVEQLPKACWPYDRKIPIQMIIRNTSSKPIQLWIDAQSRTSPYELSWLSYQIQGADGAMEHGPGGHGPLPQNELNIDPGDSAKVIAFVYDLSSLDYSKDLRVHVVDSTDKEYNSPYFRPCSS
jgi:hypothetical protein